MLINRIGITAGSLSTLIAYLLLYIYRLFDLRRFQKFDYNIKKQIQYIVLIVFMLLLCQINRFETNIFNLVFGSIFFICLSENEIKSLMKDVKCIGGRKK